MTSPSPRPGRLVLAAHSVDLPWLLHLAASWVVVVVGTQVGIPAVDPRLEVTTRPMEVLGVAVLTWSASVHALPLVERPTWLTATAPRGLATARTGLLVGAAGLGCFLSWCVAGLLRYDGVPSTNVIGVWLLLFAVATLGRLVLGPVAAFVGPAAIVGLLSTGAIVPWGWNLVFNTSLAPQLWFGALGILLLGVILLALRPPRLHDG